MFLDTGGSYKATAERLMLHKNSVQYRIHKADESLGRPVGDSRHDVELALQASHWLGSSVLQPVPGTTRQSPPGAAQARASIAVSAGNQQLGGPFRR